MYKQVQFAGSNEFHDIAAEARRLAIEFKHGFIDFTHLYVALFTIDCEARKFCDKINDDDWVTWLQNYYPATDNKTIDGSLPLTVYAENVVYNAQNLAHTNGDTYIYSVHLLLALLCFNCEITEAINRRGIIFEDIAEQYYQKPIEKSYPKISVLKDRPYSKFEKLFINEKSREEKVERLYQQACEMYWYQQYDDCLSVCQTGLSLSPNHVNFLKLRISCYIDKRDFKSAEYYATAFLKDNPNDSSYEITLAYVYNKTGRLNDAAEILEKLLLINPQDEFALNNMGFNLLLQENFEEAIPFLERAIAVNPTYAYPWYSLGFIYFKMGQTNKGLELINKSLEVDKGNPNAYKYKGIIFLEQNNKGEAFKNFNTALRYGYTKKYGNEVLELIEKLNSL